ncbi:hydroxysqualene dehydroxylase [Candidatus Nitrospira nitrificans]|uniref:Putative Pytoene desaturase n=1 Tax=Candidatus Nitrospira nitrificans TaxID=1742973 RepID=A0A0S4LD00_9BACT|nr:FAD-dependent oxidoreductase [Candidatus Nitrospira nitrificans]CUS33042.1 putative Pytoene desaturase [Candidatus Nitrospira nitrificans]
MTAPPPQSVLVLGAGLAGLTTAYHLHQRGYEITLLDHPDWRDGFRTDASQPAPIVLGCHQETRRILRALDREGSSEADRPIPLEFQLPDGRIAPYQSARLPGAFQWMMSLFSFHGLSWQDRWRLFSHVEQIWEQAQTLPADLESRTADEWLTAAGQSPDARERIWDPLAQWLAGNALTRLSAATFVHLLSTVFLRDASAARLTHLAGSVDHRFIAPMKQALQQRHARIVSLTHRPILRFGQTGVSEVRLHDDTRLRADRYIIALSYRNLLQLMPERLLTRYAYFAQITELKSLSEVVIRLTCPTTKPRSRLLLLSGRPFHQLTGTSIESGESDYRLSAVGNALAELNDDQLIETAQTAMCELFSGTAREDVIARSVVRENHAALSLAPGAAQLRPLQQSPIENLLVTGAWTDTGWPANLESALVSAHRCAELVSAHPA